MTHEEWKKLVVEYKGTDSKDRRDKILEELDNAVCKLCMTLEELYNTWGQSFIEDDDYRKDKGCYELDVGELDEDYATVFYSDVWRDGGVCRMPITVRMKYLDEENREQKKKELREKYKHLLEEKIELRKMKKLQIEYEIEQLHDRRERLTKEAERIQRSLRRLEEEED